MTQTLSRVQINGLLKGNKKYDLKLLVGRRVKPPKAKPKVQTFANLMIEILLDCDF